MKYLHNAHFHKNSDHLQNLGSVTFYVFELYIVLYKVVCKRGHHLYPWGHIPYLLFCYCTLFEFLHIQIFIHATILFKTKYVKHLTVLLAVATTMIWNGSFLLVYMGKRGTD